MKEKKKIGLMGGTFDPIHVGHLQIAELALRQFSLDAVWFLPTGNSYHKGKQAVATRHRVEMVRRAIEGNPLFSLCDVEIHRSGPTYTADTLRELTARCPESHFYYMVGEDSLDYMDRWYAPDVIFRLATVLAAGRGAQTDGGLTDKIKELTARFHADIRLIEGEIAPVSSSEIRRRLQAGEDVRDMLSPTVLHYIRSEHLYGSESPNSETTERRDMCERGRDQEKLEAETD